MALICHDDFEGAAGSKPDERWWTPVPARRKLEIEKMIKNVQVELNSVSQNAHAAFASVEHQLAQAMRLRAQAQANYEAFIRSAIAVPDSSVNSSIRGALGAWPRSPLHNCADVP